MVPNAKTSPPLTGTNATGTLGWAWPSMLMPSMLGRYTYATKCFFNHPDYVDYIRRSYLGPGFSRYRGLIGLRFQPPDYFRTTSGNDIPANTELQQQHLVYSGWNLSFVSSMLLPGIQMNISRNWNVASKMKKLNGDCEIITLESHNDDQVMILRSSYFRSVPRSLWICLVNDYFVAYL